MKHLLFYFVTFLLASTTVFGQSANGDDFNRSFLEIYMHRASVDVASALKAADSLYQSAQNDVHRLRSLMLISDMHHRLANRDSSIHYVRKAEHIAQKIRNYIWLARIYGVLSTQYRETGLFSEGKRCLEKGLEAIVHVEDSNFVNQFKGNAFQELGLYAMEEKKYEDAIPHLKRSEAIFSTLPDSVVRNFGLAQAHERLGVCYLELEMIDSAETHFRNALAFEHNASQADTPVKGFIYAGLGRVHLAEGNYQQADSCFQKALTIAEASGLPNLKINVYKGLSAYYHAVDNGEAYRHYSEKFLAEMQRNVTNHKQYADHILARIQMEITEMAASNRVIGVTSTIFVALSGIGMALYIRKQKRNQRRFKLLTQAATQEPPLERPITAAPDKPSDTEKDLMPEATQKDLLKKLERFERSHQFRDRNISIAVLAGKMRTNTKYLSFIINTYRNKDFNSYVNDLRINYIIAKMKEDDKYLNYKISYLAEECGFATHSQFTKVFKSVAGMSPSAFMECMKRKPDQSEG